MTSYVTWAAMDDLVVGLKKDFAAIKKDISKRLLWRGSWKAGETYTENDMVQDKNAISVCTATATQARPGDGAGWRTLAHFRAGLK